jgi:hypothetical protein
MELRHIALPSWRAGPPAATAAVFADQVFDNRARLCEYESAVGDNGCDPHGMQRLVVRGREACGLSAIAKPLIKLAVRADRTIYAE